MLVCKIYINTFNRSKHYEEKTTESTFNIQLSTVDILDLCKLGYLNGKISFPIPYYIIVLSCKEETVGN